MGWDDSSILMKMLKISTPLLSTNMPKITLSVADLQSRRSFVTSRVVEGVVGSNVSREGNMCTRGVGDSMNRVEEWIERHALCDLRGGFLLPRALHREVSQL